MNWDVLYEGYQDEFDFALVDVGDAVGELKLQAFSRGRPAPVLLADEGMPEELLALAGHGIGPDPLEEGTPSHVIALASPILRMPIDVEITDEEGELRYIPLGWRRLDDADLVVPEGIDFDPGPVLREYVIKTLRQAPCVVWDYAVLPAGDRYVLRFKVTLRTDDPEKEEALSKERLMTRVIRSDGTTADWPIRILEDSSFRHESGEWRRVVVYSIEAPSPIGEMCLWVWSRVLGSGGFRGFPNWFEGSLLRESLATMASVAVEPDYDAWMKEKQAASSEVVAAEEPPSPCHLSVIVVEEPEVPLAGSRSGVDNRWAWLPWVANQTRRPGVSELKARTAASLRVQTHRDFDVRFIGLGEPFGNAPAGSVAAPEGSWSVVMGLGDVLEPDALGAIAEAISSTEALAVYADEDVAMREDDGTTTYLDARLKPTFSRDELYFGNGVGLPLAVAPELMDPKATSAYELALRALELGGEGAFHHIEDVLLHAAASRPFATGGMAPLLAAHLERQGIPADVVYRETNLEVDPGTSPERHPGGVLRVRYGHPNPAPLVSVIIPNRDHADYLRPCVDSILELTRYPRYEVVIVENGSREEATLRLYEELQARDPRVRVVGWHGEGFNYPAIVNRGVEKSSGDLVCLLNNDTVVLDGDWMDELAGPLLRPEVGVTGALLSFEDGLVQHAGMMAVPDGGLAHQQQNLWPGTIEHGDADGDEGYLMTLQRPVAYTMVTGACQMIRRDVYERLGGYDEALAVGYNDADFCLRAAKEGYRSLFTPYARLTHREFGTRHREATDDAERERWLGERRLMMERHPEVFGRDPFLNRALDPDSRYFSLKRVRWVYETETYLGWPIENVSEEPEA